MNLLLPKHTFRSVVKAITFGLETGAVSFPWPRQDGLVWRIRVALYDYLSGQLKHLRLYLRDERLGLAEYARLHYPAACNLFADFDRWASFFSAEAAPINFLEESEALLDRLGVHPLSETEYIIKDLASIIRMVQGSRDLPELNRAILLLQDLSAMANVAGSEGIRRSAELQLRLELAKTRENELIYFRNKFTDGRLDVYLSRSIAEVSPEIPDEAEFIRGVDHVVLSVVEEELLHVAAVLRVLLEMLRREYLAVGYVRSRLTPEPTDRTNPDV